MLHLLLYFVYITRNGIWSGFVVVVVVVVVLPLTDIIYSLQHV